MICALFVYLQVYMLSYPVPIQKGAQFKKNALSYSQCKFILRGINAVCVLLQSLSDARYPAQS